ncbi:hypothetical protein [Aeromicrobium sp. 179-A 4D2 NHS]|uniref:hypothetical protein n=1 Tax=Aeromicrobium sp. 179-A 4D2 NHS TaxID=3142375 RepID=UPI0039A02B8A
MNFKTHLRRITDLGKEIEAERTIIRNAVKEEIEAGAPIGDYVEMTSTDVAFEQGISDALLRVFPYLSHVTFTDGNLNLFLREGDKWLTREDNIETMSRFIPDLMKATGQQDRHMTVVIYKKPKTKRDPLTELVRFEIVTGELLASTVAIGEYPEFFTSLDEGLRTR